jgi:hypothetical protein
MIDRIGIGHQPRVCWHVLFLMAVLCTARTFAQSKNALDDRLHLKESLANCCVRPKNASEASTISASYQLTKNMVRQEARASFAAAYFCAELEQSLECSVPVEWQRWLECILVRPHKQIELDGSRQAVRVIAGQIIGLSTMLKMPRRLQFESEVMFHLETDKQLFVAGRLEERFTDVFVFDRVTGNFLKSIPHSHSQQDGGNVREISKDSFLSLAENQSRSAVYCYSIKSGSIAICRISIDTMKSVEVFNSDYGWHEGIGRWWNQ